MDVVIPEHLINPVQVEEQPYFYSNGSKQHHHQVRQGRPFGFICVHPRATRVQFCQHAARMHGEQQASRYSLQGFAQWYLPEQRNLLIQSLLLEPEQKGFQIDLRIAWNQQAIRIWFIPCRLQQLYFRCGWVRPLSTHQSFAGVSGNASVSSSSSSLRKA